MKTKKAFITILLVKEAEKKSNREIEKEMFESLHNGLAVNNGFLSSREKTRC